MWSLTDGKKPWKTKLSSAGLVYLHFGHRVIAEIAGEPAIVRSVCCRYTAMLLCVAYHAEEMCKKLSVVTWIVCNNHDYTYHGCCSWGSINTGLDWTIGLLWLLCYWIDLWPHITFVRKTCTFICHSVISQLLDSNVLRAPWNRALSA